METLSGVTGTDWPGSIRHWVHPGHSVPVYTRRDSYRFFFYKNKYSSFRNMSK